MTASVWSPSGGSVVLSNLNRVSQEWTAGVGATLFPLSITPYTPGAQNLEVFKNGAKLLPSQVTEQGAGTSFVIAACAGGEKIEAVVYPATSNSFEALALNAQNSATAAQNSADAAATSAASIAQYTGAAIGGNLTFTSTGQRIVGDLSNATVANRLMFQTSTVNGSSMVGVLPNGTSQVAGYAVLAASDPANASVLFIATDGSVFSLNSSKYGAGPYIPVAIYTAGIERFRVSTAGHVGIGLTADANYRLDVRNSTTSLINLVNTSRTGNDDATNYAQISSYDGTYWGRVQLNAASYKFQTYNTDRVVLDSNGVLTVVSALGGLGYGPGAGGTVIQPTSKTTAVTLNKPVGTITMNAASLAAGASVQFAVNNNLATQYDTPILSCAGSSNYRVETSFTGALQFGIRVTNLDSIAHADALEIHFSLIKGVYS